MSASPDVRYYSLPNVKHEGWAIVVVHTKTGFFATDSDWGTYAYTWGSMGVPDTRQFLSRCDVHYLHSKFMSGKPEAKELDVEASLKAVRKLIRKAWPKTSPEREHELELLERTDFSSSEERAIWWHESELPNHFSDWYEELVYVPNRQCMSFLTKVWPRLVEIWKQELATENGA